MSKKIVNEKIDKFFLSLINYLGTMVIFFISYIFFSLIHFSFSISLFLFILENLFFLVIFYFLYKKVNKFYMLTIIFGAYIITLFYIISIMINKNGTDVLKNQPVEKSTFWTNIRLNEYKLGTVNTKIRLLKESGLSKEAVKERLKNNTEFRQLIKNGDKIFLHLYE